MRVAVFSSKPYDRAFLEQANATHELTFFEPRLTAETAALAQGFDAVCLFVNDLANAATLRHLHDGGVKLIALRCAGFNNVDLHEAHRLGIRVARVPAYSPHAVAEHTLGLILALNRSLHRAYNRVREGNFALDGLMGFDLHEKTAGIIGTGQIGSIVARLLLCFGCRVIAYDTKVNDACRRQGVEYVSLDELLSQAQIITLHCPLLPETDHMIDHDAIQRMREGVMLINTSRGALIDTPAVIQGLKSGRIAWLGLDVYEEESNLFFQDLSGRVIQDDVFARLQTFPNVLVTGHQAFFTREAMTNIAQTTIHNLDHFSQHGDPLHPVDPAWMT